MEKEALLGIVTLAVMAIATAPSSAHAQNNRYHEGQTMIVTTSHYGKGDGFHGKVTSSCTRFNRNTRTVAHRKLPFGTILRVANPKNGRSVVAKVTDRGPYVRGRQLDVSYRIALDLNLVESGTGKVRIVIERIPERETFGDACTLAAR